MILTLLRWTLASVEWAVTYLYGLCAWLLWAARIAISLILILYILSNIGTVARVLLYRYIRYGLTTLWAWGRYGIRHAVKALSRHKTLRYMAITIHQGLLQSVLIRDQR